MKKNVMQRNVMKFTRENKNILTHIITLPTSHNYKITGLVLHIFCSPTITTATSSISIYSPQQC